LKIESQGRRIGYFEIQNIQHALPCKKVKQEGGLEMANGEREYSQEASNDTEQFQEKFDARLRSMEERARTIKILSIILAVLILILYLTGKISFQSPVLFH
jgi:hypothetical protein